MAVRKMAATLFASATLVAGSLLGLTGSASATGSGPAGRWAPATGSASATHAVRPTHAVRGTRAARPDDSARAMRALTSARQHRVERPARTRSADAAQLSCAYLYVCGQASNGSSFAYTKCSTLYQLPNLVGNGPLINNQSAGTVAYFYDKNQQYLFSSTAYQSTTVNWTPVWYAIAC